MLNAVKRIWNEIVLFILIGCFLFLQDDLIRLSIFCICFILLAVNSLVYARANKDLALIYQRGIALSILNGLMVPFLILSKQLSFELHQTLAIYLVLLSYFQMYIAMFSGRSEVKHLPTYNLSRMVIPLVTIVPTGLVIAKFQFQLFGNQSNEIIVSILFFIAAGLNFLFYRYYQNYFKQRAE